MHNQITLRQSIQSDNNFIMSSWLNSYRKSSFCHGIDAQIYYRYYRPLATKILPNCQCIIAVSKTDENLIYGYLVYRWLDADKTTPVISYVYVKQPFRRLGIAKYLIKSLGEPSVIISTAFMPWFKELFDKYKIQYVPFLDLKFLGE